MSPSQAASFSKQLDRGCQQSAAPWWHCFQQDALVPARGDPAATCRPHGCCTLSSNLTETHREELRPRGIRPKGEPYGSGRCRSMPRWSRGSAGSCGRSCRNHSCRARSASPPCCPGSAGRCLGRGAQQPVSGRNWSRTFGARMGLERRQLSELTGGLGCPPAKTQPWDQSWPLLTF